MKTAVWLYSAVYKNRWEQATSYLPQSKLQRGVFIQMRGYRTQLPFTSWAWNLLGLSFALNAIISLTFAYGYSSLITSPTLLRVALLTFETAAPTTLLVACVVRYAIWPRVLQAGGDTAQLKGFQAIVMHNVNVMLALVEVSLLGGIPVRFSHFPVAPLFGIIYILFTWFMIPRWIPGSAQFIYFFFDTTLHMKFMVISLLSLLLILLTFYGLFGAFDQVLTHLQGGPLVHAFAVVLLSSVVCRFRD